jgi:hypothetical protein
MYDIKKIVKQNRIMRLWSETSNSADVRRIFRQSVRSGYAGHCVKGLSLAQTPMSNGWCAQSIGEECDRTPVERAHFDETGMTSIFIFVE